MVLIDGTYIDVATVVMNSEGDDVTYNIQNILSTYGGYRTGLVGCEAYYGTQSELEDDIGNMETLYDSCVDVAQGFMDESVNTYDQPFFLYFAHTLTHSPDAEASTFDYNISYTPKRIISASETPSSSVIGKGAKESLYEQGIRMMNYIRFPALASGKATNDDFVVGNVDFAPTIFEMAGLCIN